MNNLLVNDGRSTRPLFFVWQPDSLCGRLPDPPLTACDHNVFVTTSPAAPHPLILWSPAAGGQGQAKWDTPEELHRLFPQFAGASPFHAAYDGPLFRSPELGNYQIMRGSPGATGGAPLPVTVSRLLGGARGKGTYVGAYPPTE